MEIETNYAIKIMVQSSENFFKISRDYDALKCSGLDYDEVTNNAVETNKAIASNTKGFMKYFHKIISKSTFHKQVLFYIYDVYYISQLGYNPSFVYYIGKSETRMFSPYEYEGKEKEIFEKEFNDFFKFTKYGVDGAYYIVDECEVISKPIHDVQKVKDYYKRDINWL